MPGPNHPLVTGGREKRQKILDFLNTHGRAPNRVLAKHMGMTPLQARGLIGTMVKHHELRFVDEMLVRYYIARVPEALDHPPPVKAPRRNKLSIPQEPRPTPGSRPGVTMVNRCDDSKPPHPDQGGQGRAAAMRLPFSATILERAA